MIRKLNHIPVLKVSDKALILSAEMGRRKPYRKLNAYHLLRIALHSLNFIGSAKQGQVEKPVVLRFILPVGNPLIGKSILGPITLNDIFPKGLCDTLLQPGYKRRAVNCLNLFISVVDC